MTEMKSNFENKEFEGENDTMFTFLGHNGKFCITLNAKCIHSVKSLKAHNDKLEMLVESRELTEITQ